ncbi:kinase-like domain-containing protein [Schizophyllum commune]
MSSVSCSPPRPAPIKYKAPLGTRWEKEKAAAGGAKAFDHPDDPKQIGPWILGECVGKGASGRVKIAKHQTTGQLAAVKILPLAPLVSSRRHNSVDPAKAEKMRLGIDREITMMKLMNHPNIMRIYDVHEGETQLYLVLEYVEGGELFDFLVNRGKLSSPEALVFFKQIIYGLNYAHTFSIIHRDLKPENILIASLSPPSVKIADWGMAAFAPPTLQLDTSCGSPHYASPEIVNGESYTGNSTDIWSCGVILFALLTGRLPFDDKDVRTLLAKVRSGRYDMPAFIDPLAKDLLSRMLVIDVNKRITMKEILAHPWLQTPASLIGSKLPIVPPSLINPPLPPPPELLARPIASPDRIDPEIFRSLRIIWGRHADPKGELIKRDLCSPPGYGLHAKAFYYLLMKHQERLAPREPAVYGGGSSLVSFPSCDGSVLGAMRQDLDRMLGGGRPASSKPGPSRLLDIDISDAASVRSASTTSSQTAYTPPIMSRTGTSHSSRDRPASPAGPRPQSTAGRARTDVLRNNQVQDWQTAPQQHRASFAMHSRPPSAASYRSGSSDTERAIRPLPPRRGYSHSVAAGPSTDRSSAQRADVVMSTERRRSAEAPRASQYAPMDICAPKPMRSVNARTPVYGSDAEMAHIEDIASNRTNRMSVRAFATPDTGTKVATFDVEKTSTDVADWSYVNVETPVRAFGKELDNVARPQVDESAKEMPHKPKCTLTFSLSSFGLDTDDATDDVATPPRNRALSVLGSPITLGSPNASMKSPVVGEFKGWFSNLFHWKNHTTADVIYSANDAVRTRREAIGILQSMGVLIEGAAADAGGCMVRCRVEGTEEEKGSGSTVAAAWRRLKEEYEGRMEGGEDRMVVEASGIQEVMDRAQENVVLV